MKFSLVNGERREAEKGLSGICVGCEQATISKCGQIKIAHWAHKSRCNCDHWWENETEWHRTWKNHFPSKIQEIRHKSDSGEWHIADVKTAHGWVLEFQNSPISIEERDARNAFYMTIVWIVNGTRLKRDKDRFFKSLESGMRISKNPQIIKVLQSECPLIEKWANCKTPVFFDFGEGSILWCLYPTHSDHWSFIAPVSREDFISCHQGGEDQLNAFLGFLQVFAKVISNYSFQVQRQQQLALHQQLLSTWPTGFQRRLARQRSHRRL